MLLPSNGARDRKEKDFLQRARQVDKVARIGFPLSFLLFNIVFWTYYLIQRYVVGKDWLSKGIMWCRNDFTKLSAHNHPVNAILTTRWEIVSIVYPYEQKMYMYTYSRRKVDVRWKSWKYVLKRSCAKLSFAFRVRVVSLYPLVLHRYNLALYIYFIFLWSKLR